MIRSFRNSLTSQATLPDAEPDAVSVCVPALPVGGQVRALDGIRGLAIFFVMIYHMAPGFPGHGFSARFLTRLFSSGWFGVDLFFALSGFLITGILLDARGSADYFRSFYARRMLRIFPLYYLVLFLVFFVTPAFDSSLYQEARKDQAWFWLYLMNIPTALRNFPYRSMNHLWSLAVEEQFYLLWPALVLWTSPRGMVRLCWCLVAAAFCSRVLLTSGQHAPMLVAAYTFTPCRSDGLACGALAAASLRHASALNPPGLWQSRKLWLLLALAVGGVFCFSSDVTFFNPVIETIGISLLALFFGVSVGIAAVSHGRAATLLGCPPLALLGKYSYCMYIIHPAIYHLVSQGVASVSPRFPFLRGHAGEWASMAASLSTTMALAWMSWTCYESRWLSLKRYFPRSRTGKD